MYALCMKFGGAVCEFPEDLWIDLGVLDIAIMCVKLLGLHHIW